MITSNKNPLIKRIQLLQKKKKERNKEGVFIVEGLRAIKEIPLNWDVETYIASSSFIKQLNDNMQNISNNIQYVADNVFENISDTKTPQGIMAILKQKKYNIDDILDNKGFFIIGDEVQDPGNLGTIIRTAHGAGANGVFLSSNCVNLYNPKTIRASMGSIFHIPILLDLDIISVIKKLEDKSISVFATDLNANKSLYDNDYTKGTAIIIGNEANGITEDVKANISNFIKIPMPGNAESLNASIAAGICMYEVVRQRCNDIKR